jgi:MFS transporter, AAHS family, 4-hydroxybenzoate transporter
MSKLDFFEHRKIKGLQLSTLLICFLMNMLDGMDVLVMSFAAKSVSVTFNLKPIEMGKVFSFGLLGMTLGTLFLAPLADKIGRKTIILISCLIMGSCIFFSAFSQNLFLLMLFRFLGGLGIGSMLACTASLASEFAPKKTKDFWVSFVVAGFPIGAVGAGLISQKILLNGNWSQLFKFAGLFTLFTLPLILFFLSESLDYLLKTQPKNALQTLNNLLKKHDLNPINTLPSIQKTQNKLPVNKLLSTDLKQATLSLWLGLFLIFATLYFLQSWIPKLASDAGLNSSLAIYAGTVFNLGAFFGIISQGLLSTHYGLKKTIGLLLIFTGILMFLFGFFIGTDWVLVIFGLMGFGVQGGFVGLYALSARLYSTEIRTLGIGWAMSAGRIGAIVGPLLAGIFLEKGLGIIQNFILFGVPAVISGLITFRIQSKNLSD